MKIDQIPTFWKANTPARTNTFTTDGQNLYSYSLRVGLTSSSGKKTLIDYTGVDSVSSTTSRHINAAKPCSDIVLLPQDLVHFLEKDSNGHGL
jgi:hypothetical protein